MTPETPRPLDPREELDQPSLVPSEDPSLESPSSTKKAYLRPIDVKSMDELGMILGKHMKYTGQQFTEAEMREMAYGGYSDVKTFVRSDNQEQYQGHAYFKVDGNKVYVNSASTEHVATKQQERRNWLGSDEGQASIRKNIERFVARVQSTDPDFLPFTADEIHKMASRPGRGTSQFRTITIASGPDAGQQKEFAYFIDPENGLVRPVSREGLAKQQERTAEWLKTPEGQQVAITTWFRQNGLNPSPLEVGKIMAGDYGHRHEVIAAADAPNGSFKKGDTLTGHPYWDAEKQSVRLAKPETVELQQQKAQKLYAMSPEERKEYLKQAAAERSQGSLAEVPTESPKKKATKKQQGVAV